MGAAFIQARIDAAKAEIVLIEAAITAVATGSMESYTLDTGQTRQTVTKLDIDKLNKMIDSLMNRIATYEARLTGNGVTIGRGGW